jgi:hypothetical protein
MAFFASYVDRLKILVATDAADDVLNLCSVLMKHLENFKVSILRR